MESSDLSLSNSPKQIKIVPLKPPSVPKCRDIKGPTLLINPQI